MLDYDDVLEEVGEFGRWQIWLFALLWIPSAVSAMQVGKRQFYFESDLKYEIGFSKIVQKQQMLQKNGINTICKPL